MATLASRAARRIPPRALIWLFHLSLPLVGLWLLLANPQLDLVWTGESTAEEVLTGVRAEVEEILSGAF